MAFEPTDVEMIPVDGLPEEQKTAKEKKETTKPKKSKKKPTYSKSRYGRLAPVKVMNRGITDTINNTVLKHKKKKLPKDECEIGEAVMYMVEYYTALDINHPALVMMSAVMGITFTVMQLAGDEDTPEAPKKKTTDVDIRADTK